MYRSDGSAGDPVAEVAMVFIPNGTPPADGWPVVAWGHGTSGVGDSCAPSKYPSLYPDPWPQYGNEVARLVRQGYVVTAPDYEGLGTPGLHSYLNTDTEAFAMIDAVRAARHLAQEVAAPPSAPSGRRSATHRVARRRWVPPSSRTRARRSFRWSEPSRWPRRRC